MGVPCMPVRRWCLVIGPDIHDAIGVTPVGIPAPSKFCLYTSAWCTYVLPTGDPPVWSVRICGEPAINKGADNKFRRPHASIVPPTPAVTVPPITGGGLAALHTALGSSKPLWGPHQRQGRRQEPRGDGAPLQLGEP